MRTAFLSAASKVALATLCVSCGAPVVAPRATLADSVNNLEQIWVEFCQQKNGAGRVVPGRFVLAHPPSYPSRELQKEYDDLERQGFALDWSSRSLQANALFVEFEWRGSVTDVNSEEIQDIIMSLSLPAGFSVSCALETQRSPSILLGE